MTIKITTKDPVTDVDIIYPADSRHTNQTVTTGEDCTVSVVVYQGATIPNNEDKIVEFEVDIED